MLKSMAKKGVSIEEIFAKHAQSSGESQVIRNVTAAELKNMLAEANSIEIREEVAETYFEEKGWEEHHTLSFEDFECFCKDVLGKTETMMMKKWETQEKKK